MRIFNSDKEINNLGFDDIKGPFYNNFSIKNGNKGKLPVLFMNKSECCGCYACVSVCPNECILMIEDLEGFRYPVIEADKCIKCLKCEKVCPISKERQIQR